MLRSQVYRNLFSFSNFAEFDPSLGCAIAVGPLATAVLLPPRPPEVLHWSHHAANARKGKQPHFWSLVQGVNRTAGRLNSWCRRKRGWTDTTLWWWATHTVARGKKRNDASKR